MWSPSAQQRKQSPEQGQITGGGKGFASLSIYWGLNSRIHKEQQQQQKTQTPPISKLANELKKLPKELQIDLKYIQNLTSLNIKEIEIEKTWRFLSRPVQNGDYQGSNKCWREHREGRGGDEGTFAHSWWECKLVQPPLDQSGGSSKP